MGIGELIVITGGALAGGFVSGLAGFGTGITAIGIWLYAVSPPVAASLVILCSVIAQIQTLPRIWRSIEAKRVLPFLSSPASWASRSAPCWYHTSTRER